MATKKAAESTLYHVHPTGFWKKFRDLTVVNPEISTGVPIAYLNRYPQPGSRPEKYATPATKASDPAQNPYWKRDMRRRYPQLSVVGQQELATLLIQHAEAPAVSAPADGKPASAEDKSSVPEKTAAPVDLTAAISTITAARKVYSESQLPPRLPTSYKRWTPALSPDAPHDPGAYFPMSLYK